VAAATKALAAETPAACSSIAAEMTELPSIEAAIPWLESVAG
jgi:hypothetical protein